MGWPWTLLVAAAAVALPSIIVRVVFAWKNAAVKKAVEEAFSELRGRLGKVNEDLGLPLDKWDPYPTSRRIVELKETYGLIFLSAVLTARWQQRLMDWVAWRFEQLMNIARFAEDFKECLRREKEVSDLLDEWQFYEHQPGPFAEQWKELRKWGALVRMNRIIVLACDMKLHGRDDERFAGWFREASEHYAWRVGRGFSDSVVDLLLGEVAAEQRSAQV